MKLRLNKSQRVARCDTDKAYAIKYSKYGDSMLFLSKKYTKIKEDIIEKDGLYWATEYHVEFPQWIYEYMNDNQKSTIKLLQEQWKTETNS
tara:strand:+ start:3452 stop:3724 length:273 start_codon:yes stop_codon:yes gene_type:complete